MPLIHHSTYTPPRFWKNRHLLTIYPSLFRKVMPVHYRRVRLITADQDFIDLDFSDVKTDKIVILLHGLEGDASRVYIKGMVHVLNKAGYTTVAVNFRGCSGEPNIALRSYHSGETSDLDTVIQHLIALNTYKSMYLAGFSLGGNVLLKYLGEKGEEVPSVIKAAVALSVPCDLRSSAVELAKPHNSIYMRRFLRTLKNKLQAKAASYPDKIDVSGMSSIKNFQQFDDNYTAPMFGFANAEDYWKKSSCISYLPAIRVPALLINALDDPFLGPECYPYKEAENSDYLYLETPQHGGHVGFMSFGNSHYWSETRALEFIREHQ